MSNLLFSDDYAGQLANSMIADAFEAWRQTRHLHAQSHYDIATDQFIWFACDGRVWRGDSSGKRVEGKTNLIRIDDIPDSWVQRPDWLIFAKPPRNLPHARLKSLKDRLWPMRPVGAILTLTVGDDETVASFAIRQGDKQRAVDIRLEHAFVPSQDYELYHGHIKPALKILCGDDVETPFEALPAEA